MATSVVNIENYFGAPPSATTTRSLRAHMAMQFSNYMVVSILVINVVIDGCCRREKDRQNHHFRRLVKAGLHRTAGVMTQFRKHELPTCNIHVAASNACSLIH